MWTQDGQSSSPTCRWGWGGECQAAARLTLADLAMRTDVYCKQGCEGLESVSILSMAWKGHHLSPHQNGFHSRLFSSKFSLLFTCFESCHFPCPRKPSVPSTFFPELISILLPEPKVHIPHTCCKMQTGITCQPFPPGNRKTALGRQESHGLLAGQLGWAFHPLSWAQGPRGITGSSTAAASVALISC